MPVRPFAAALTLSLAVAAGATAAPIGITSATLTGPTNAAGSFTGTTTFDAFTSGGTSFTVGATASSVSATGTTTFSFVGTSPGSLNAAATGNRADTAANNIATATITFPRSIAAGEVFFVIDFEVVDSQAIDAFQVQALSGGAVVGSTVSVDNTGLADLGRLATPSRAGGTTAALPNVDLLGVSFFLADFGLTAAANVNGLLVTDNVGAASLDPTVVGIGTVVPEPASAAMLVAGVGAVVLRRRR